MMSSCTQVRKSSSAPIMNSVQNFSISSLAMHNVWIHLLDETPFLLTLQTICSLCWRVFICSLRSVRDRATSLVTTDEPLVETKWHIFEKMLLWPLLLRLKLFIVRMNLEKKSVRRDKVTLVIRMIWTGNGEKQRFLAKSTPKLNLLS
jgi:hypothetical protein